MQCEIVELAHVEDEMGYPCGSSAAQRCCDCSAHLCDEHAASCAACGELFC
jgi:hypothetical protein